MTTKNILLITGIGVAGFLLIKNSLCMKNLPKTVGILVPSSKSTRSNETNRAYPDGGLQVPESMDLPNLTPFKKNGLTIEESVQTLFKN